MTIEDIKLFLHTNKVCIVTNSSLMPSSLFLSSLKTYIDYIPIHNFWVIPGIYKNERNYGLSAFIQMLLYMLSNNNFDYVIYLDEDVYVKNFELLINEFKEFIHLNCCIGGIQDGGSLCHRNHSKLLVNTFISFWNIKLYRESGITNDSLINHINDLNKKAKESNNIEPYKEWISELKANNPTLYQVMDSNANYLINLVKEYMDDFCDTSNHESEYANIVRNDESNPVEPHQIPYSFDDETATKNFEPYYYIEQYLVTTTNTPIYYLFATDFFDNEYKNICDTSGLTSAVRTMSTNPEIIAVHTWFSRAYTKWPNTETELKHTKRINSIIKTFSNV